MELVTKILSSNFFSIYTDMIRITNTWKGDTASREKFDFNSFVKKRLMLLSKFQFKTIKHFNLSLCLRLQFLLTYHLLVCLDEKSLQVYSQFLQKENKKLMFSIIQNEKNFEVIVRELRGGNFAYMDFLIEVFYALKLNVDVFIRTQQVLSGLGFMDFITGVISQMSFQAVGGQIVMDINNKHFQQKERFLSFLELILFFVYKNKQCFILHVFPNSSTLSKPQILNFLFTLPFQSTFKKCNVFILRLLEIMVVNINELAEEPARFREFYAGALVDVVERYHLFDHKCFFLILEMLVNNKESDILRTVAARVDVWPHIIGNMRLGSRKLLCATLVKITRFFVSQLGVWPNNANLRDLLRAWVIFLSRGRSNMLTSSVHAILADMHRRDACRIKGVLSPADYQVVLAVIKPDSVACL